GGAVPGGGRGGRAARRGGRGGGGLEEPPPLAAPGPVFLPPAARASYGARMAQPSPAAPAVETRALRRVFKGARGSPEVVALAGVDLRIEFGEVFGLLGPNGA